MTLQRRPTGGRTTPPRNRAATTRRLQTTGLEPLGVRYIHPFPTPSENADAGQRYATYVNRNIRNTLPVEFTLVAQMACQQYRPSFYIRVSCAPPFERLFRLQLTSFSLRTCFLLLGDTIGMVLKASTQCVYTQPSTLLKTRPTLLSRRRRNGLKIEQGYRQTDGGPRGSLAGTMARLAGTSDDGLTPTMGRRADSGNKCQQ